MDAHELGRLVKQARRRRGFSKSELGRQLGRLPDSGRVFDAAGVTRIEEGGAVRVDRELVQHLIDVLGLDLADARERLGTDAANLWHAAGLWPPDLSADGYRDFVLAGGTNSTRAARALRLVRAA